MGLIAASLLLFVEEENAFWIMVAIVEDLLPASYYSSTLLGSFPKSYMYNLFLFQISCRCASRSKSSSKSDTELLTTC